MIKRGPLSKLESIEAACRIVSTVYRSIGDYTTASDCFCQGGGQWGTYQNQGNALRYVRAAVIDRLKADGFKVDESIDPLREEGKS